ncbi:MAG: cell envelope integrity protein TolA, partial [Methylococcales bacterium]
MHSKKKFTWPFILALVLHIAILGLFVVSFLFKTSEIKAPPEPEVMHATVIDSSEILPEPETPVKTEAVEATPEPPLE